MVIHRCDKCDKVLPEWKDRFTVDIPYGSHLELCLSCMRPVFLLLAEQNLLPDDTKLLFASTT